VWRPGGFLVRHQRNGLSKWRFEGTSHSMSDAKKRIDPVVSRMQRLLSGPERPGQTFTMPGTNFDGLYRMARRIRAALADDGDDNAPVCMGTDDRSVLAAAMLATLAGGPDLLIPDNFSEQAIGELQRQTGFTRIITRSSAPLPTTTTVIEPQKLEDEVEVLATGQAPNPDRSWVVLYTSGPANAFRRWSKTPRNLLGEVDYLINRYAISSSDRILASVPALHIYGLLYSLLVPLLASARVVAQTPTSPEAIEQQMTDASPTIFVSVPVHYRALREKPPQKGCLRLAFSSTAALAEADGKAFSEATGADLVELYGSNQTGGIATRCRSQNEEGFIPYRCIQWRVAGDRLEVRSAFLSRELPIRSSGWFTLADRVKAHGREGFMIENEVDRRAIAKDAPIPTLTFEPAGLNVSVDAEKTIQAMGAEHGIDIRADCGGMGVCGKCRVLVHPRSVFLRSPLRNWMCSHRTRWPMVHRLACQARATGNGTVTIPDSLTESSETLGKTGITGSYPVDPMIRRLTVDSRSPGSRKDNTPESLVDWLAAQVDDPAASAADMTRTAAAGQLSRQPGNLHVSGS
jgi:ferredoxin